MFAFEASQRRVLSQINAAALCTYSKYNRTNFKINPNHPLLATIDNSSIKKYWLSTVKALSSYDQPIKVLYASVSYA